MIVLFIIVGFFILVAIGSAANAEDDAPDQSARPTPASPPPTPDANPDEKAVLKHLHPMIELVCHFVSQHTPWTAEKTAFLQEKFDSYCRSPVDRVLLQQWIKKPHKTAEVLFEQYLHHPSNQHNHNVLFAMCCEAMILDHGGCTAVALEDVAALAGRLQPDMEIFERIVQYMREQGSTLRHDANQTQAEAVQQAMAVLDLTGDLTEDAINRRFRQKARDLHPDRNPGVSETVRTLLNEKFAELNAARALLLEHVQSRSPSSR